MHCVEWPAALPRLAPRLGPRPTQRNVLLRQHDQKGKDRMGIAAFQSTSGSPNTRTSTSSDEMKQRARVVAKVREALEGLGAWTLLASPP